MTVSPSREQIPIGTMPVDPTEDEFRSIFNAEVAYVWNALRRFGVRAEDVEDVAHNVWVIVHRKLGELDRSRPIRPWLLAISFRAAAADRRLAHKRHEVPESDDDREIASEALAPDEELAAKRAHRLVFSALDALDLDRRAVFVMHEMDERPMKEIAEALDIPLNTGYSRLRLAREEFDAAIKRLRLIRGVP